MMKDRETRTDPLRMTTADTPMTRGGASDGPVCRCSITNTLDADPIEVSTIGFSPNPACVFPVTATYSKEVP